MAQNISVSFPDDDDELLEWIEQKSEEGVFANRSHGIVRCVQIVKERHDEKELLV